MFGYVAANFEKLSAEETARYRAYYCGLCEALQRRFGTLYRLSLNYDMTFLAILLDAALESGTQILEKRCPIHPFMKGQYLTGGHIDYAADMNVALVYYKLLDDRADDGSLLAGTGAYLMKQSVQRVLAQYPLQAKAIEDSLARLAEMERADELNADLPANAFGELMAALFVPHPCEKEEALRAFGRALGRCIYIMDACVDLTKDLKRGRYNPMVMSCGEDRDALIDALMQDAVQAYGALGIKEPQPIIENILYSGILAKYEIHKRRHRV